MSPEERPRIEDYYLQIQEQQSTLSYLMDILKFEYDLAHRSPYLWQPYPYTTPQLPDISGWGREYAGLDLRAGFDTAFQKLQNRERGMRIYDPLSPNYMIEFPTALDAENRLGVQIAEEELDRLNAENHHVIEFPRLCTVGEMVQWNGYMYHTLPEIPRFGGWTQSHWAESSTGQNFFFRRLPRDYNGQTLAISITQGVELEMVIAPIMLKTMQPTEDLSHFGYGKTMAGVLFLEATRMMGKQEYEYDFHHPSKYLQMRNSLHNKSR